MSLMIEMVINLGMNVSNLNHLNKFMPIAFRLASTNTVIFALIYFPLRFSLLSSCWML